MGTLTTSADDLGRTLQDRPPQANSDFAAYSSSALASCLDAPDVHQSGRPEGASTIDVFARAYLPNDVAEDVISSGPPS